MRRMQPTPVRPGKRLHQPTLPGLEPEPSTPPKVTNRQIAEVLSGIADLLESQHGNPYRIQQTVNKKLKPGEKVVFTGHYHIDRTTFQNQTGVKPYERKWIRLLVIDRKPTG